MLNRISQYTVLPQHSCVRACMCVCVCFKAALQSMTSIRETQVLSSFSQNTRLLNISQLATTGERTVSNFKS